MPHVPVVVVGASAGGVEALRDLVAGLPADLPAAVLVVLHIPRTGVSALPSILERAGALPASQAVDGEPLLPGHIYAAPPDHHLLMIDGHVHLSRGPTENGHRPAVDPLFRSAARAAGPAVTAVVLSGSRDDGTAGAAAVSGHGGVVFVQDPDDALYPSMPRSVLDHVPGCRTLPVRELGPAVAAAARAQVEDADPPDPDELTMLETAMADLADVTTDDLPVEPAGLACPTCHGALFDLPGEPRPRYRCRVGHAWSPESLVEEQTAAFEGALWMALRALEEKASLAQRMTRVAADRDGGSAEHFRVLAEDAEHAARLIRDLIGRLDTPDGLSAQAGTRR